MRGIERRLARLEASTRRVVFVDATNDPQNVPQRLQEARREAGPHGVVVHIRYADADTPGD